MATTLSSPLPDPGGCLICQRLALAVVLVDLANTSKEIIPCFSITARFAGSHRSLRPDTARLPVQSVPVAIRQRGFRLPDSARWMWQAVIRQLRAELFDGLVSVVALT